MTHEEMIAVIEADMTGKKLEYKDKRGDRWERMIMPFFDFEHFDYRIVPEQHYRPYANAKEFIAALRRHGPLIWDEDTGYYLSVNMVTSTYIMTDFWRLYFGELTRYTWQDGSCCGVKEE